MSSKHFFDWLLYFLCGFPFLYLLPIPSDTQPYAFLAATLFLVMHRSIRIPHFIKKNVLTITMIVVILLLSIPFVDSYFLLFRKAFNYLSFFIVTIAVYNSLIHTDGLVDKWIKWIILIWLFVGVVQTVVTRDFMKPFVANMRTSATRGVNSMASEPSFYGYVMVFFALLSTRFKKNKELFFGACILQIIILAQSSVTIVYLMIFAFVFIFERVKKARRNNLRRFLHGVVWFILGVFVLMVVCHVAMPYMKNTRMVVLLNKLIHSIGSIRNLEDVYRLDVSVGERVESIMNAFSASFSNYGIPNGFVEGEGSRIMSGFGTVLFELGIFGAFMLIHIMYGFFRGFANSATVMVGILAMMFSAVQFGSPVFAFVFGYAIYMSERRNRVSVSQMYI